MTTQSDITQRTEHDLLGDMQLPADALHGIHTVRALKNFQLSGTPVNPHLTHAYGAVKLACARTNHALGCWDTEKQTAIEEACLDMAAGALDTHILVDTLQGGAGTSTNMNVNEVLANRALQVLGVPPGCYDIVNPLEHLNRHQSTNDTYPTALKVAAIYRLRDLQAVVIALQEAFQAKEKEFADIVKIGRTECQDAVLITLGREMGAYAEALTRDRWRIYKCEERLRVVPLGGTAIGTGLGAPRRYIFKVVDELRSITGLGLARAENMVDATQNTDAFVEVSGILKALATTLIKISNDLRFLSTGPDAGIGEIRLPERQAGSSIMPGKVNPVIPESVVQTALTVLGHDQALTQASALGHLELNAFMPLIAHTLLSSLTLLENACRTLTENCVNGLEANTDRCRQHVDNATATVTALIETIGYEAAQHIATMARTKNISLRKAAITTKHLTDKEFDELITPEHVMRLGSPTGMTGNRHNANHT
ncbi:MAG: aspartate ammonia-lyase [Candidatus Pacebacteria bacterium]|nr:aspartate ammonia-lyase [Candidatus Paceibacterota bacterium]